MERKLSSRRKIMKLLIGLIAAFLSAIGIAAISMMNGNILFVSFILVSSFVAVCWGVAYSAYSESEFASPKLNTRCSRFMDFICEDKFDYGLGLSFTAVLFVALLLGGAFLAPAYLSWTMFISANALILLAGLSANLVVVSFFADNTNSTFFELISISQTKRVRREIDRILALFDNDRSKELSEYRLQDEYSSRYGVLPDEFGLRDMLRHLMKEGLLASVIRERGGPMISGPEYRSIVLYCLS
jgi:hypothetical protein